MTRQWRRALIVASVLALCPVRQTMVAQWTLRVTDETGAPLPGIAVDQNWHHYSVNMSSWSEGVTDSAGVAVFPQLVRWRPAGYWLLRAVPVILNVHGSFGARTANVRVFDHAVELEPGVGLGDSCSQRACIAAPLHSDFRVFLTTRSEASTRAYFAANRTALESFADDWEADAEAGFLGRHRPTEYRWEGWQIDQVRDGFRVWSADYKEWTVASLDEAFRTAKLDPARVRSWFERADELQIYAVRKRDDGAGIDIQLFPGAHGLRYAPQGGDRARAGLYAVMKPLTGRWFYFADATPGQTARRR